MRLLSISLVVIAALLTGPTAIAETWDVSIPELKSHVETLAQPAWEGRLANSVGGKKARAWLKEKFKTLGFKVSEQPVYGIFNQSIGANLIVQVGSDPMTSPDGSCVIIGAHYDHLGSTKDGKYFPGADDNASGVAALLEIARTISIHKNKIGCLTLAAWDFEEGNIKTGGGLKGSKYFAAHPLFPLKKIGLSLTFDLLGGAIAPGLNRKLFVFGSEFNLELRNQLALLPKKPDLEIEPVSTLIIEPFGPKVPRSDYGPFRSAKIPFLFFSTGTSHHYHRTTDTADKIQYEKLAQITESILDLIWPYVSRKLKLEDQNHFVPNAKLVKEQDLKLTLSLLNAMSAYLQETHASTADLEKISVVKRLLSQTDVDKIRTCELQSSFFRILETNHVKAPIPPRLIRFLLFCPIQ